MRDSQLGLGDVTESGCGLAIVNGELVGVDAEEIIEGERRQKGGARGSDFEGLLLHGGLGGADIGIVVGREA